MLSLINVTIVGIFVMYIIRFAQIPQVLKGVGIIDCLLGESGLTSVQPNHQCLRMSVMEVAHRAQSLTV